jgi:deoxyadenosine/deoxycytidine kinase
VRTASEIYVAVAGNIGAGKSTLTRLLAETFSLLPVFEAVEENPYLEDFYRDMRQYAFHSQMFFLGKRLEQHLARVNPARRVIQDRTVFEDAAIFARNLYEESILSERDYRSYLQMYEAVRRALRPPDLLIYLEAGLPTLRRHIGVRGRSYEAGIEDSYLRRLDALYRSWVDGYDLSELLVIPADELDFVQNENDRERVLEMVERCGLSRPIVRAQQRERGGGSSKTGSASESGERWRG